MLEESHKRGNRHAGKTKLPTARPKKEEEMIKIETWVMRKGDRPKKEHLAAMQRGRAKKGKAPTLPGKRGTDQAGKKVADEEKKIKEKERFETREEQKTRGIVQTW